MRGYIYKLDLRFFILKQNSLVYSGAEYPGVLSPSERTSGSKFGLHTFKILKLPNHNLTFLSFFFNNSSDHISQQQMELTENRGPQIWTHSLSEAQLTSQAIV